MKSLLAAKIASLITDTRGNFATITALVMVGLFGAIGLAVDYSRAVSLRAELTAAADAAVLAGAKRAAGLASSGGREWEAQAQQEAWSVFASNLGGRNAQEITFNSEFRRQGATTSGAATFSTETSSLFASLIGKDSITVSDTVRASVSSGNYLDIGFLIDNSSSMGIGATEADQELMYRGTYEPTLGYGCAFACHVPKDWPQSRFTPERARNLGAKLRIDVVREALRAAIEDLKLKATAGDQIRVSIYTFSNTLQVVLPPTTDLDQAILATDLIDLIKYKPGGPTNLGGTFVSGALGTVRTLLNAAGSPGDGQTPTTRKSYLVLFSDGIEDSQSYVYNGRTFTDWQGNTIPGFGQDLFFLTNWLLGPIKFTYLGATLQPFDHNSCTPIKNDGRSIYTVQMRYATTIGMRDQWWNPPFIDFILSIATDITRSFDRCASTPSKHVTADGAGEILPLFEDVVRDIAASTKLRLTN